MLWQLLSIGNFHSEMKHGVCQLGERFFAQKLRYGSYLMLPLVRICGDVSPCDFLRPWHLRALFLTLYALPQMR